MNIVFKIPQGKVTWVRGQATKLLNDSGKCIGYLGAITDITERKQAEDEISKLNKSLERRVIERTTELAATNAELETFSYSVSHDLRAPLRSINGFTQALIEDCGQKLSDSGKIHLQRVRNASQNMGQLIDDLLKLSRVSRSDMLKERCDLSILTHDVVTEFRRNYPDRQVEFIIQEGVVVKGDKRLLRLVMENLLGNAMKFTDKNPGAKIEFKKTRIEGRSVYFVRDDGAGFDMAYADKLFGPFQRLHSTSEFPGSGIGLATVQRIIHRHGGRIWAESAVGKGATFYFTL